MDVENQTFSLVENQLLANQSSWSDFAQCATRSNRLRSNAANKGSRKYVSRSAWVLCNLVPGG